MVIYFFVLVFDLNAGIEAQWSTQKAPWMFGPQLKETCSFIFNKHFKAAALVGPL